jgi:hypothetical protein
MTTSPIKTVNWFDNNHSNRDAQEEVNNYDLCYDVLLELRKAPNSEIDQNDFAFAAAYLYKNEKHCEKLVKLTEPERKQFILSRIKNYRSSHQKQQIPALGNSKVNVTSSQDELLRINNNNFI